MTDKLESLLSQYDENHKYRKNLFKGRIRDWGGESLVSSFIEVRKNIIRPTMDKLMAKIEKHDHEIQVTSGLMFQGLMPYIKYEMFRTTIKCTKSASIEILCNWPEGEVVITTRYSMDASYQKEQTYSCKSVEAINPELLINLTTDTFGKILRR